jgi:mannose-6-phosphate isomerase-like protein (cupin superfamily)
MTDMAGQASASRGQRTTINLLEKIARLDAPWQPRVVAEMNDYQFKVVKLEGDFVWHRHADTDETFIVLQGELRIDFRDGSIELRAGEMAVVPKGVEHKPYAAREVRLLLIEPRGVLNTGDEANERTAENDIWI